MIDKLNRAHYSLWCSNYWLTNRVRMIGAAVCGLVGGFLVASVRFEGLLLSVGGILFYFCLVLYFFFFLFFLVVSLSLVWCFLFLRLFCLKPVLFQFFPVFF